MSYSVIPVFIPHAGCPNDCVFCNQKRIAGTVKAPKPSEVSALLCDAFKKTKDAEIAFYGGSFTALPRDEQEAYLKVASEFNPRAIRLSTRPDAIDENVLALLKKYGVKTIELGAQSMDDTVLLKSNRGHTAKSVADASEMIKAKGFELILQMMIGLPGDSKASATETANKIASLKPNGVRIYPTVVVRDTALCDMWQNGEYKALSIEEAVDICTRLCDIFDKESIPIIRMGLNPTEDLSGGDALAGAYHPAFGQMVWAESMFNKIKSKLDEVNGKELVIYANPRDISNVAGHKGKNKKRLMQEFDLSKISIIADETLAKGEIRIGK